MTGQQPDELGGEEHREFYRAIRTPYWGTEPEPADNGETDDQD